jgi:hypothetical protein
MGVSLSYCWSRLAGFYSVKGGWKLREAAEDFALCGWEDPGDGEVKGGGFGVGGLVGGAGMSPRDS